MFDRDKTFFHFFFNSPCIHVWGMILYLYSFNIRAAFIDTAYVNRQLCTADITEFLQEISEK